MPLFAAIREEFLMQIIFRLLAAFLLLGAAVARADIVLLLSDDKPAVTGVAQAIQSAYPGKVETYNLRGNRNRSAEIVPAIQYSGKKQLVAVGLLAAQVAKQHPLAKQVVFCQVPDAEEADLVTPWMKGVSAIPALSKQFRIWKLLDPNLKQVGVFTSRGMKNLASEAQAAAKANNIELVHVEVSSDREASFALRKFTGKIQGLWLAPDSRILSSDLIRDVLSYSAKKDIGVLVFSPALLKEGGLLSASPNFNEIAHLVLKRLESAQNREDIPGEAILPLSAANMTINARVAKTLGLPLTARIMDVASVE